MQERLTQLEQWLATLGYRDFRLTPASADASFRRYLRLHFADESLIVMDAPPQQEPCDQFIAVAGLLRGAGLNAPEVVAANLDAGFLLLTDFGNSDYLSQLDSDSEAALYADALAALRIMQTRIDAGSLPNYDVDLLQREMDLFRDWFLGNLLGIDLDPRQQSRWLELKQMLIDSALAQPQVFVHRDYHSRNLMKTAKANPGILDFQDAVKGPITYDLVSLLRDCYVAWPAVRVEALALGYYEAVRDELLPGIDSTQFMRWFDLMGIQRHLKAIGIFSRLHIRDGKAGYLGDIPRTLDYLRQVSGARASMAHLHALIDELHLEYRVERLEIQ